MAIKRKLSDEIRNMVTRPDETVHIHVPPTDPTDDIIVASEAFINTVSNLKSERDELRKLNEQLNRKCVFLQKANEMLTHERDLSLRQTHEYVRANGEVGAIIGSMLALAERASHANTRVQVVSDTMPLIEPPAPQPQAVYDQNGVPLDAPSEITLEDIKNLSTVLARAGE